MPAGWAVSPWTPAPLPDRPRPGEPAYRPPLRLGVGGVVFMRRRAPSFNPFRGAFAGAVMPVPARLGRGIPHRRPGLSGVRRRCAPCPRPGACVGCWGRAGSQNSSGDRAPLPQLGLGPQRPFVCRKAPPRGRGRASLGPLPAPGWDPVVAGQPVPDLARARGGCRCVGTSPRPARHLPLGSGPVLAPGDKHSDPALVPRAGMGRTKVQREAKAKQGAAQAPVPTREARRRRLARAAPWGAHRWCRGPEGPA